MQNKLAFIRLALIPLFIFTIVYQKIPQIPLFRNKPIFPILIFLIFLSLEIADRFLDEEGGLSDVINPICSKIFFVIAFFLACSKLGFPKWITYIVISREILVTIGWFVFYQAIPNETFGKERGILGKGSCIFQAITILLYLFNGMSQLTYIISIVMLTFAITSFIDYLINV
ncbi:MAG: CDP-alcohol phosphatidyltransferase family protein [bacterium]